MSETETQLKSKRKNKKAEILYEESIHNILLFYGISFILLVCYYCFALHRIPFIITMCLVTIASFVTYYNFYKRRIVITRNKFYVYRLCKKTISLSFAKDFLHIKFEKTKLGRLLNYGTILLVTQDDRYYKVHFVKNPEKVFYAAIGEYENVMVILNPQYERQLSKDSSEKILNDNEEQFEKIN